MRAAQAFLGLLQYLVQQVKAIGCGALAELVEILRLAQGADGLGVDGAGEMQLGEQLAELGSGSLEVGFVMVVGSQADDDVMRFLCHNKCKGSKKNGRTG